MNALRKREPFHEMTELRQSMDHMFDQFFWAPRAYWHSEMDVALDVAENPEEFIVKASLPGIKPEDIDITFTERTLTIKGEVEGDEETKDARYYLRERWSGSFARSVQLPAPVQSDKIEASFDSGVLTLRLPKVEEVKPKRIEVHAASPQVLEGKVKSGNGNK
jgi:HSP20 family protein